MKRGMDKAVADIVEQLQKMSTKVTSKTETEQVATVASNFDSEIGKMIAEATEKVGKDGVITVEEGKTLEDRGRVGRGDAVRPGLPERPTSSPIRTTMEAVLEDAYILIHEKKISVVKDLVPVLERVAQTGKPLLIIAEEDRGRGAGDPGDQQAAGHVPLCRGQGAGLRRPPQGHARRHRRLDRRQADLRGAGHRAGERQAQRPGPGQEGDHRQGQHDDHRGRRQPRRRSRAGSRRSAARSPTPRATTTARSSKNGWPSWPAASPRSTSAPRPRAR